MTRRGTLAPPYSGLPDPRRAGPMWPAARQAQKVPKNKGSCRSRSLCRKQGINSALGELRSAAGGLQTVLKQYFCLFPCIYKAFRALSCCFPLRVNPSIYRLFYIVMRLKSLVYYRCQFPRFIILNLCVNVHRHLAVLVTG